jgi:hypothetical protein
MAIDVIDIDRPRQVHPSSAGRADRGQATFLLVGRRYAAAMSYDVLASIRGMAVR